MLNIAIALVTMNNIVENTTGMMISISYELPGGMRPFERRDELGRDLLKVYLNTRRYMSNFEVIVRNFDGIAEVRNKLIEENKIYNSFEIRNHEREIKDDESVYSLRDENLWIKFLDKKYEVDKEMWIITQNGIKTKMNISGRNTLNTEVNNLAHTFGCNVNDLDITSSSTETILGEKTCYDIIRKPDYLNLEFRKDLRKFEQRMILTDWRKSDFMFTYNGRMKNILVRDNIKFGGIMKMLEWMGFITNLNDVNIEISGKLMN
jgi:hypothetical protein